MRWYSTDSVSTTGASRFSATPVSARSLTSPNENESSAALLAAYDSWGTFVAGNSRVRAADDVMLMMRPSSRSSMPGRNPWISVTGARRLRFSAVFHRETGISRNGPMNVAAALFTRTSGVP